MADPILFYYQHPDVPHWQWSNFADFPVWYGGLVWRDSESPFQARKFLGTDPEQFEAIRRSATPKEAAALGRDKSRKLRPDWEQPVAVKVPRHLQKLWDKYVGRPMLTKDWVMLDIVRAKVRQHSELQDLLLSYGDAEMIEHPPATQAHPDRYWADGADGSGQNILGKILMIVRDELRMKQQRVLKKALQLVKARIAGQR